MISITQYERVAETLGLRLEYNFRANCHTLSSGLNAINGDFADECFRRRLDAALACRAVEFLASTPEADPRRPDVIAFMNRY